MKNYKSISIATGMILALQARAETATTDFKLQRQQYDSLYSQYVDFCGTTQYKEIGAEWGGIYGHAVMYIKGACRDESRQDFPHLRKCNDADGANAGAGISLDSFFTNVAWTAVDGRDFLFYGDLPEDQPLDKDAREAIIAKAAAKGVGTGIVFEDWIEKEFNPKNETREHFLARKLFGTEYAVSLARTAYCARIPIAGGAGQPKDALLNDLIAYLNGLNEKVHAKPGGVYDPGSFNCTTLVHNALAAIGFWAPLDTNWSSYTPLKSAKDYIERAKHYKDLAVPLNEVLAALMRGSEDTAALHMGSLLSDKEMRGDLLKYGWLPTQPGVVFDYLPVHTYQNKFFITDGQPTLFTITDELLVHMKRSRLNHESHEFTKYLEQKSVMNLHENLLLWQSRFKEIARRAQRFHPDDPAFPVYKQYLEDQISTVDKGLDVTADKAD